MVENQPMRCTTSSGLQPIAASATRAARTACGLRTADLLRPSAAEQGLDLTGARRLGRHENAELVVREARIVGDRAEPPGGEQRVERDAENRRERAEQDRHLEHDHDVRRDRADRLAAEHERPIVRHVQRDPGADGAARDPADQREHPHGAHRLLERILDLVPGDGRVDREDPMARPAQVGLYVALANRSNGSPASDTTMITKRSNHIPMFTKIEMTNRPVMLVWTFFDQSSHGRSPLQMFIVQLAHQNGPKARYQKAARSWALPLNQAVKFSVQ